MQTCAALHASLCLAALCINHQAGLTTDLPTADVQGPAGMLQCRGCEPHGQETAPSNSNAPGLTPVKFGPPSPSALTPILLSFSRVATNKEMPPDCCAV